MATKPTQNPDPTPTAAPVDRAALHAKVAADLVKLEGEGGPEAIAKAVGLDPGALPDDAEEGAEEPEAEAEEVAEEPEAEAEEVAEEDTPKVNPEIERVAKARKKAEEEIRQMKAQALAEIAEERRKFEAEKGRYDTGQLKDMFRKNPMAFFEEMGLAKEPEVFARQLHTLARQAYAHVLGDKAPAELKKARDEWEAEQRLIQVEQELAEYRRREEERRAWEEDQRLINDFKSSIRAHLQNLPEEMKHLRRLAAKQVNVAVEKLFETAIVASKTLGYVPGPEEIAQLYEEQLQKELALFLEEEDTTPQKTKKSAEPKAGKRKTLSNEDGVATRKVPEPRTHEERIQRVIEDLERGRHLRASP